MCGEFSAHAPTPPNTPRLDPARLHRGRRASDVLRAAGELDIADPMGLPRESFERCATELDELMRVIAGVV